MKRIAMIAAALGAAALLLAGFAAAHEGEEHKHDAAGAKHEAKHASKTMTVTGEIVDMGCYMGHGTMGEKHAECAAKCIAGGMPMGLVTAKGDVYLLGLNHKNADPYNKTKEWAGKQVKITGKVATKGGITMIDVASSELVTVAATSTN